MIVCSLYSKKYLFQFFFFCELISISTFSFKWKKIYIYLFQLKEADNDTTKLKRKKIVIETTFMIAINERKWSLIAKHGCCHIIHGSY